MDLCTRLDATQTQARSLVTGVRSALITAGAGVPALVTAVTLPGLAAMALELPSTRDTEGGLATAVANAREGLLLNGIDREDISGRAISDAGDVNGDGVDDFVIGAPLADPDGQDGAGEAYVVFGRTTGFPAAFELAKLFEVNGGNGRIGFVIKGVASLDSQASVVGAAGDVNGDGIDDLFVAGSDADPGDRANAGQSFVIFGNPKEFPAEFALSELLAANGGDGSRGFALNGREAGDRSGIAVAGAGDVNGDGLDDLIIGASTAEPAEVYLVFGRSTRFPAEVELSSLLVEEGGDGSEGVVFFGDRISGREGSEVATAGDVNEDGFADVLISEPGYGGSRGRVYLIFGGDSLPPEFELTQLLPDNGGDGSEGVRLLGAIRDEAGRAIDAAGDLNDDGIDDFIIGAPTFSGDGKSFVVYGRRDGFPAEVLLPDIVEENGDLSLGVALTGPGFSSGTNVSDAGDVNGDGIDDVIIGNVLPGPGESYVVFGSRSGFRREFALERLFEAEGGDGSEGFVITGIDEDDRAGTFVSGAGDVNGDGLDDVLVSADFADPGGRESAGETYLIFGRDSGFPAEFSLADLLPGFDGSVVGINANSVRCSNISDPQSVRIPLPEPALFASWSCDEAGVSAVAGDEVSIVIAGTGVTARFAGRVDGVVDGFVRCRNLSQGVDMDAPIVLGGEWDCAQAGLPVERGDAVRAVVIGVRD